MEKMSDEELLEWLKKENEATRPFRVDRLRFLVEEFGEPRHLFLPGGKIPLYAFKEARLCFLDRSRVYLLY